MSLLYSPVTLGPYTFKNRIAMSPMTRSRSVGNVPDDLVAEYYKQRAASAGLIITEGTSPSPDGLGYARIPGIFSAAQVAGWKKVADAVHGTGTKIFMQLMHTGRVGHPNNLPPGANVIGPSAVVAAGEMYTDQEGMKAQPTPKAMTEADIKTAIGEFEQAAKNAVAAGLEGVELHAANGYLLEQFIRPNSNIRTDAYGGSIENRARLMLEVAKVVTAEAGPERTGIRISPVTPANDASDSNPQPLFDYIVDHLNALKLTYIHVIEGATGGPRDIAPFDYASLRKRFKGAYIANNGYDFDLASKVLAANQADLIAFGKPFISNPDLVERLRRGAPLNEPDKATFYGGGAKGYTDYPALGEALDAAQ